MKNIQAVKIGNMVNLSINGKLHKKVCGSVAEANELFKFILIAKEDPSDANMKNVMGRLNEKLRVAMEAGLEADPETGNVYLAGFNTPIPITLVEIIKEYNANNYPLDAILNFWKLLMINPDVRVRTSLFDFISTHDFSLTDNGYMIVYKAVYYKDADKKEDNVFAEFVSNKFLHVKKTWKEKPSNYVVYKDAEDNFAITSLKTVAKWDEEEKEIEVLGNLGELFNAIFNTEVKENGSEEAIVPEYTDMHTRSMSIKLGVPVWIQRVECDADPSIDCSYGLHVGATKYVENFANRDGVVLACFVDPANVVAVPKYDHSKMRVSEYFPFALATYTNGKIDIVEQKYFEDDYQNLELEELEEQILRVQSNELPIGTAIKADAETRPMAELMKILETRLIDIE